MSTEAVQWYRSKVDWWVGLILLIPPAASIFTCVALALDGQMSALPVGVVAVVFVAALYLGLVFPLRYGVGDDELLVRFGMVTKRVPLADISEVCPTRNPLSSPALSLDRLRVQFGPGFFNSVMISPAERDRFLDELAAKSGLTRDGDRLLRLPTGNVAT
jgi:hypothetical protein